MNAPPRNIVPPASRTAASRLRASDRATRPRTGPRSSRSCSPPTLRPAISSTAAVRCSGSAWRSVEVGFGHDAHVCWSFLRLKLYGTGCDRLSALGLRAGPRRARTRGCRAERLAKSPGVEARVEGPAEGGCVGVVGHTRQRCCSRRRRIGRGAGGPGPKHRARACAPLNQIAQRGQELLVLGFGPDRHPHRPLATQRRAGANQHPPLAQAPDRRPPRRRPRPVAPR